MYIYLDSLLKKKHTVFRNGCSNAQQILGRTHDVDADLLLRGALVAAMLLLLLLTHGAA